MVYTSKLNIYIYILFQYLILFGISIANFLTERLYFPNNSLTDESMDAVVKILSGASNIKMLDLTNNHFADEGGKKLATFLLAPAAKGGLEILNLSLNNMREGGCAAICKVITWRIDET